MIRIFVYPFLIYRSFFLPFFVLSAIVVPCWLVYRLYRHRTSGNSLSLRRESLFLIVVLYLSGVVSATLTPNHPSRSNAEAMTGIELRPRLASLTCTAETLPRGSKARFFCMHNAAGNILLFIPLGILLPLVWRRLRFWRGVQIAIAMSVSIELLQLLSTAWGSYRLADVNDVILNTLGATLGLMFIALLRLGAGLTSDARERMKRVPRPT